MSEQSEWAQKALAEVGELVRGRRFTKNDYVESGLGCIHYAQIHTNFGAIARDPLTFLAEDSRARMRLAHPGDLVIAATSENVDDVGKAVAWLGDDDVAVHDDCYIFRHGFDPAYVSYFFASSLFHSQKVKYVSETKVVRISGASLSLIEIPVPPQRVQERIVEVVSAVDDQIAALDDEAEALEGVYRAAAPLLWCTAEGDEAVSRSLGDVMHLDVVRTPMESGTTYHLAGVLNAGKGLVDKDAFDGADAEYTAMNVLRENQVVMRKLTAWEGPITVVPAEFEGFVASNEFPTFTLSADVAPAWMKHVCRTPRLWAEMQSRVVGTVQRRKRLNPDQLLSLMLPIPSRPEQEQAADALDAIEGQVAAIRAEAARLRKVRARLLSGLLDRTIDIESAELEV
ncbi:restriction endonuclease subunit S [Streptomyces sp. NBC_01571]|uniref:restriction endonuclease subunit S n=1 Tax=Streptomyces sp. NBC_01571 TaxID=2975883 RepID=UPI0022506545|nr:restriction endonuclease subunit S [Streptomyces sp. NBC_01571]MCX4573434.1 restriction endonuclease subunit S [Streptomyces sp. NBC_01571]